MRARELERWTPQNTGCINTYRLLSDGRVQRLNSTNSHGRKHWADSGRAHFIGMAGLRGYMPNCCDSYETWDGAAESLAGIHDLSENAAERLRRDGYLDLPSSAGNEYCEITICHCDDPMCHSDMADEREKQDWQELGYYGGPNAEE